MVTRSLGVTASFLSRVFSDAVDVEIRRRPEPALDLNRHTGDVAIPEHLVTELKRRDYADAEEI